MEERLQKYMASCGVASRRKCEELILAGNVKVNGTVITELGIKVNPEKDEVIYNGNVITKEENKVYIMLNKPTGYITSLADEKGRKTILDIVKVKERVFPIGRLDYDSSGLLLLTNDGEVYNKIIHPRVELKKKYVVLCEGEFTENDGNRLRKGVDIGGYITAPAEVKIIRVDRRKSGAIVSTVEISIHEGKNRQVRRMCSAVNHNVLSLKRVQVGELSLGYLKVGEYRQLREEELNYVNSL
ncbi:MAG: pseudouridine synthase [Clostridium sp.]